MTGFIYMNHELTHNTNDYAKYRFEKALQMLETAKLAKLNNDYYSANNRIYYALFHAIRSVLALDKVDFKKHSNVLGYFNKNYIATCIFDKFYGKLISSASIIRNNSDYEDFYLINKTETEQLIVDTENFLKAVRIYLQAKNIAL